MGRKERNNFKLQVPLKQSVYDALKNRSEEMGFDSVQAYVRFWAKAEASGRNDRQDSGLRKPEVQALRYLELLMTFSEKEAKTVQEALDDVLKQLNNVRLRRYIEQLFGLKGLR